MKKIEKIENIQTILPMTHPFTLEDVVLRNDEDIEELTQEEVLSNAANKNLTSVIVPKVVSE